MTIISDDPDWWQLIPLIREYSYFTVASFIIVAYDWALTFGQEFELVWRQRWSLMTVLYLLVRYIGILYTILSMIATFPLFSLTDTGCTISYSVLNWTPVVVNVMLNVIMINSLHAMYRQSRTILVLLIVVFLVIQIFIGTYVLGNRFILGEEVVLSGTYLCVNSMEGNVGFMSGISWILDTPWAILMLCLAVWITMKHFHDLQRGSTGFVMWDCLKILLKTHVLYVASFIFRLSYFVSGISDSNPSSAAPQLYGGFVEIVTVMQTFMLGPRFILALRECYAETTANSNTRTMASIVFQERIDISASSSV